MGPRLAPSLGQLPPNPPSATRAPSRKGRCVLTTNNLLTAIGVSAATCATLLAQADPSGDRLGMIGALIALLVLVVRTVNELGKAWLAFEEAQLRVTELKNRVTELERERDASRNPQAAQPAIPATGEPAPICRYTGPHATPAANLTPLPEAPHTPPPTPTKP